MTSGATPNTPVAGGFARADFALTLARLADGEVVGLSGAPEEMHASVLAASARLRPPESACARDCPTLGRRWPRE